MAFFKSAIINLLVVLTTSCAARGQLNNTENLSQYRDSPQTEEHFNFIEHTEVPSSGSLYNINNQLVGSCVLIEPTIALTAGHCIEQGKLKYARFGNEEILIIEKFIHKDYKYGDDIGYVVLANPSEHKQMDMFFNAEFLTKLFPLHTIAHGGGKKKMSKLNIFRYYGILKNKPNEIVFLPLHTTVWFGDSGGALVFKSEDDIYYLVGIITHFGVIDGKIYECAARRTDNIDICDDSWELWNDKYKEEGQ
jgi:hypothetical protein